jgi:hypothetical protein
MTSETVWTVETAFTENEATTRADAVLVGAPDRAHGWGRARRDPLDADVPTIGQEVAAARALSDLAHRLLDHAAGRIEQAANVPVDLHL